MDRDGATGRAAPPSGAVSLRALSDGSLSVDAMGRVTAADGALAAIIGREPPGLIGTPVADLLPGWSHAEDPESVWHGRLRRSDGSEADVRVAAIRDPDDACSWHLYLRQSGATAHPPSTNSIDGLREIIDLVPGFLFAKDAQGRFLFVNRTVASAFGDSPERITGRTDSDYGATPEAVARYRASDNAVLVSRRPWTVDKEHHVHADGSQAWYQTTKVPFRDPATGSPAVLGLATDITARVETEMRLARESALARMLMRLATEFINLSPGEVGAATDRALAELGAFVGADRAWVFEYDFAQEIVFNSHEWCAEGITPQIDNLGRVPFDLIPDWPEIHRRGETIVVSDVGSSPDRRLREFLELQGIRSLVLVPMPGDPDPLGFVGFDCVRERRDFAETDVALLRVFAEMLANVRGRLSAQHLLERERQRLSDIIEGTSAGTWEWELATGGVRINEQAARMLGYGPGELGQISISTWAGLSHPDDGAVAFDLFRRHARGESPQFVCETRMRHRDGRWVWLVNRGRISSRDAYGRPLMMSGTYQDITQRREAEQALRESEERFRRLFQDLPSVAVQGFDADFTIRFWNRGSEAVYGYTAEEALGRSLIDLLVAPSEREATAEAMRRWIFETSADRAEEFPLVRRDGTVITVLSSRTIQRQASGEVEVFCFDIDISDKKATELDLQLAASVFTHSRDGILIADRSGLVIRTNSAFGRITGRDPASMIGRSLAELVLGAGDPVTDAVWWAGTVPDGEWTGEFTLRRESGSPIVALLGISAVRDATGRIVHHVGVLTDITAESEYQAHLERMAHFDALTGLANRSLLATRLRDAAIRARHSRQLVALTYVDLDGFKAINDTHGHDVGDRVLQAIAQRMGQLLGDFDTLARVGGDEFVGLIVNLPDREAARAPIEHLRALLATPFVVGPLAGQLTASIGVAFLGPDDDLDGDQLLRQADQAMYVAKHLGGSRVHFFDADLARAEQARRLNQERLRDALTREEYVLHFQPRVDLVSGRIVGCEALLRWRHPELGLLPPDEFLPGLRGTELEVDLGWWVIARALEALAVWREAGLGPTLSINVVAEQLRAADFVPRLRALLALHPGLPEHSLVLEILETGVLSDVARIAEQIRECAAFGVDFALDDFGTGYSSLAYLKHLPVRQLKIDRSFVRDMLDDSDDLAIVEGIVGLARVFRLEVVAEGVETVEQARALVGLGCPIVQGFLIAKGLPATEFASWCGHWKPSPTLLSSSPPG
jgi:diguanylate cyclase (GGDEF)-like protein/PAS domain S-box-containing protein